MRVEKRFVKTLDDATLRTLLSFKPTGYPQWRVHAAVCTILDTGCRIDEILGARVRDFDLDNLLLTVIGKGNRQRIVPFTFELRRLLTRFGQLKGKTGIAAEFMFAARNETQKGSSALRAPWAASRAATPEAGRLWHATAGEEAWRRGHPSF